MNKRAALWIGLYLLLVAAPLLVLMAGPAPPGREFWWDFSKGLGFAGLAMFGIQFALTARFRRASAPFGIDIIYFAHKYLAWIALGLVFAHWAIIYLFYAEAAGPLNPLEAPWEMTAGRGALLLFSLAVVTTQWRVRLGLEYGLWRYCHVAFATLGFLLAAAHVAGIGYYTQAPQSLALWLGLTLGWIGLWLWLRIAKPWRQKRRPYKVVELREEGPDTYTLALAPDGHEGLAGFQPGQFAWLTLRHSPYTLREHPFSISSPPEALPRVEFTIKALGDFTSRIRDVVPGERAFLDGPFGAFSPDRWPDAPAVVMIAGGVGVTPMMSIARSQAARGGGRPLYLFYANRTEADILFREELERLPITVVHILEQPPEGWSGESGFLDAAMLDRHLPKDRRAECAYFLCGPPPMMAAVEAHLARLGVPEARIEQEIFNLT
ncbi:MAG: ferric reductase-like transmembrane domain-containing protein [Allosphingosinicella sp.]|uniref:ferredoxin reductase family protein n=1 Tax=Allosphingosinicella sp. TaxID=2823234 RepID=UPI00393BAA2F